MISKPSAKNIHPILVEAHTSQDIPVSRDTACVESKQQLFRIADPRSV